MLVIGVEGQPVGAVDDLGLDRVVVTLGALETAGGSILSVADY